MKERLIPSISEMINGRVYVLGCHNLTLGVWISERQRFIGIRDKGARRYLDRESHVERGAPYGTVYSAVDTEIDVPAGIALDEQSQVLFDFLLKVEADRGETPPPYNDDEI